MTESTIYTVSSSPHIRAKDTTQTIMRDVLIALLPATFAGIYFFKFQAFLVIFISILSCVGAETIWQKLAHQKITITDLSAVVTGLLLAFCLPPSVPLWLPVVGGFFAIIIVKQFFGGLGQNFMNPALASRAFLFASWPVIMTTWTLDAVTTATPLALHGLPMPPLFDLFIGNIGGCIGETSVLALLLGGAYLLFRKVISWIIPVSFIGTTFLIMTFAGNSLPPVYQLFSGGLMLGAIFMATDYSTSPITLSGKLIFGIGCGFLTSVIRMGGGYPEGVSYAIIIMNLFVPLFDKFLPRRIFGGVAK